MSPAVITITAVTSGLGVILNCAVLYLVLSQGRKQYHYLFAGVLAICAVWDLAIFLMMLRNSHVDEVEALGYVIIPCAALPVLIFHFTCSYLCKPMKKTTVILWIFTILVMIFTISGLGGRIDGVYRYPWGNIFRPDEQYLAGNIISLPLWYMITVPAIYFLIRARRHEADPLARRHQLYVLLSLVAINLALVKVVVILGVRNGYFLTVGMLFTDLAAAIIGIAIIKDRLFDITPVIKIGLVYSALAASIIVLFSLTEHLLATYVAENIGGHSTLVHIITLALVIAVTLPVKRRVEHYVDSYFAERRLRF